MKRPLKKYNKIIVIFLFLFLVLFLVINYILGKAEFVYFIKDIFTKEQIHIIKKYALPYRHISALEDTNDKFYKMLVILKTHSIPHKIDILTKNNLDQIIFKKNNQEISLGYRNLKLNIFKPELILLSGIFNFVPGSAYIQYYNDNLFLISSIGILGYGKINDDDIVLSQIRNNIEQFIGINQFKKERGISVKDLKIFNNKIYVSYTREVTDDCWNTSVIFAKLNFQEIKFENLFSPDECVHYKGKDNEDFNPQQSGGRIINIDKNHIILSTGEYRSRYLAQNKESIFGKLIKININTKEFDLVSMGHRNVQGLFFDNQNNFILATEHGPLGGDEINLIEINKENIPNYGWAVASYGEHYGGKSKKNFEKYKKYPLLKSHKNNGFIEPIKYFPAYSQIGITEIIGLGSNKSYVASSLTDESLYFFNLDINNQIQNLERVEIGERIRDLNIYQNKIILFLENTASIGTINLD